MRLALLIGAIAAAVLWRVSRRRVIASPDNVEDYESVQVDPWQQRPWNNDDLLTRIHPIGGM